MACEDNKLQVAALTDEAIRQRAHGALRRVADRERHFVKRVAGWARAELRTAKSYVIEGQAPSFAKAIRLMAACDEYKAEIDRMVAEERARLNADSENTR